MALMLLLLSPVAFAQSNASNATNNTSIAKTAVSEKLCGIVEFVQFVAGAIGILVLAVLGIQFLTVGSNPQRRDELKTQMGLALTGLFIVLISKYLVALILPGAATC